jgi:protoheme IX farnesyltransferase
MQKKLFGFPQFAWSVLAYNLAVIMWGAYVRATGSGAGCGNHWPLCDGLVIPRAKSVQLLIEFSHRMSSGLVLILVLALAVWAFLNYARGHPIRSFALASLAFTISEALIGAALVKFQLVAHDTSIYRSVAIASHLTNTFVLLASLTVTAYLASGGATPRFKGQGPIGWAVCLMLAAALVLGITGAITALGDTLAIQRDISSTSVALARIRLLHPLIAVSVTLYCVLISGLAAHLRPSVLARNLSGLVGILFFGQIGLGLINKLLLAPIWMQLLHLFMADLVWIALVLMTAATLGESVIQVEMKPVFQEPAPVGGLGRPGWKDYLVLTKPRVISLLLFTTLTAMVIAKGGWPGTFLFLAVALGGYMSAGAANAINMVIDRDIDGRMKRTSTRPTVTQKITSHNALLFGLGMAAASFLILWLAANLLCAVLSLAGLVFYVIVYTLMLKRRTWHNIVIGGAAGAFPPLVGWAAVTNDLSLLAWYLFAIIFVWTPVHFWALAILIKDDYASAGVPMLPVVLGERITVIQIGLYAILTAVISVLPLFQPQNQLGALYLSVAALLNVVLLAQSLMLFKRPDRPRAKVLFKFSMIYLALLFLTMAVDRSIHS